MTTQDHPTLTGSQDESQTVDAVPPPVSEDAEPTVRQEQDHQSQPPAAPPDPTSASEVSAPVDQVPAVPAEDSDAERESSTEELLFGDEELTELRGGPRSRQLLSTIPVTASRRRMSWSPIWLTSSRLVSPMRAHVWKSSGPVASKHRPKTSG